VFGTFITRAGTITIVNAETRELTILDLVLRRVVEIAASTRMKNGSMTVRIMIRNVLNYPNYPAPSGDLGSLFFGEYKSVAGFGPFGGDTTNNREIDLQSRFTF
jgi:hypothetical protein